tara:strand:- start:197 stop:697 length:501 start_codon:yes stop_codon:yes gene_type:complete
MAALIKRQQVQQAQREQQAQQAQTSGDDPEPAWVQLWHMCAQPEARHALYPPWHRLSVIASRSPSPRRSPQVRAHYRSLFDTGGVVPTTVEPLRRGQLRGRAVVCPSDVWPEEPRGGGAGWRERRGLVVGESRGVVDLRTPKGNIYHFTVDAVLAWKPLRLGQFHS